MRSKIPAMLLGWALLVLATPVLGAPGDAGIPVTLAVECTQRRGAQESTHRHRLEVVSGRAVRYQDIGVEKLDLELSAEVDPAGGIVARHRVRVPGGRAYKALTPSVSVVEPLSPGAPFRFRLDALEVEVRVLLAAAGSSAPPADPGPAAAPARCNRCGGTGVCGGCRGSGQVQCHNCSGTGHCSYCNGSGCSTCGGTGDCSYCSGRGYTQLCTMCGGTGECYYCSGRGTP